MLTEEQLRCLFDLIDESDSLFVQLTDEHQFTLTYSRNNSEFVFLIRFDEIRNALRAITTLAADANCSLSFFEAAILTAWVRDVARYEIGAHQASSYCPITWQIFHNRLEDL